MRKTVFANVTCASTYSTIMCCCSCIPCADKERYTHVLATCKVLTTLIMQKAMRSAHA